MWSARTVSLSLSSIAYTHTENIFIHVITVNIKEIHQQQKKRYEQVTTRVVEGRKKNKDSTIGFGCASYLSLRSFVLRWCISFCMWHRRSVSTKAVSTFVTVIIVNKRRMAQVDKKWTTFVHPLFTKTQIRITRLSIYRCK